MQTNRSKKTFNEENTKERSAKKEKSIDIRQSQNVTQTFDIENILKKSSENNLDDLSHRINLKNRTNKEK